MSENTKPASEYSYTHSYFSNRRSRRVHSQEFSLESKIEYFGKGINQSRGWVGKRNLVYLFFYTTRIEYLNICLFSSRSKIPLFYLYIRLFPQLQTNPIHTFNFVRKYLLYFEHSYSNSYISNRRICVRSQIKEKSEEKMTYKTRRVHLREFSLESKIGHFGALIGSNVSIYCT